MITEHFTINNLIDFGTDGKFGPGRERALFNYLKKQKDGESSFKRFVDRGAITLEDPEAEQVEIESTETGANEGGDGENENEAKDENEGGEDSGEEDKQPEHEPTGKYESNHYGGGNFEIIDPDGFVIDTMKGSDKVKAKIEELNSNI